jgi:hypothetical protein
MKSCRFEETHLRRTPIGHFQLHRATSHPEGFALTEIGRSLQWLAFRTLSQSIIRLKVHE